MTVAALYVMANGVYSGFPDIECWGEDRDARKYDGPFPVIAHPPCASWGRMAERAFGKVFNRNIGDDKGCFEAALASVRKWGGVLEHPEDSRAFYRFGLEIPPRSGGWVSSVDAHSNVTGWVCRVEQGHYGHRTRKATWLYACWCDLPSLRWGRSCPVGYEPRARRGEAYTKLSRRQRAATPPEFAELLLSIARTAKP